MLRHHSIQGVLNTQWYKWMEREREKEHSQHLRSDELVSSSGKDNESIGIDNPLYVKVLHSTA